MSYNIVKTEDFEKWYLSQPVKIQLQLDGRLLRIEEYGHFGHVRKLDAFTSELKFNNGNRVYYMIEGDTLIVLLVGGNKNTQAKDIKKAKKLARLVHE